jgi:1,2-diacylglycerol 3-alpha-glucosyltransferase
MGKRIRVHFVCTGVDRYRGGIESFFREAFDGLQGLEDVDLEMYKTDATPKPGEVRVRSLYRGNAPAKVIGKVLRRNPYIIEQMGFLPGYIRHIRRTRPDVIFYSEQNLAYRLWELRKWIGVPFKLLLSNGAPMKPPYVKTDYIQQVTTFFYEMAQSAGVADDMQSLVPYGITVPNAAFVDRADDVAAIRRTLELPVDRKVVLSVGWVSATHKRMDHVVREIAAMNEPKPYLAMVGRTDASTEEVRTLAKGLLGDANFQIASVPYERVVKFYQAADVFVLASLQEGFGRVYLEALMHGLPVVAHEHAIPRYVCGPEAVYANMSQPGLMASAVAAVLATPESPDAKPRRREWVRSQFSWPVLREQYRSMFFRCAEAGEKIRTGGSRDADSSG